VDVGEALVAYLHNGRPHAGLDRAVFVRERPSLRGLSAKGSPAPWLLRHDAPGWVSSMLTDCATRPRPRSSLAAGGTLIEARELLGHARTDTTRSILRLPFAAR